MQDDAKNGQGARGGRGNAYPSLSSSEGAGPTGRPAGLANLFGMGGLLQHQDQQQKLPNLDGARLPSSNSMMQLLAALDTDSAQPRGSEMLGQHLASANSLRDLLSAYGSSGSLADAALGEGGLDALARSSSLQSILGMGASPNGGGHPLTFPSAGNLHSLSGGSPLGARGLPRSDALLQPPGAQDGAPASATFGTLNESPSVTSLAELVRSSSATSLVELLHSYSAANLASLASTANENGS